MIICNLKIWTTLHSSFLLFEIRLKNLVDRYLFEDSTSNKYHCYNLVFFWYFHAFQIIVNEVQIFSKKSVHVAVLPLNKHE